MLNRPQKQRARLLGASALAVGLLTACSTGGGDPAGERPRDPFVEADALVEGPPLDAASGGAVPPAAVDVTPAAPRLSRLTHLQYHNAVRDLFGPDVAPPSALEPDPAVEGLRAVGSTVTTLSPRGVEQAYEGAKNLALQLLTPERRAGLLPCQPSGPGDAACLRNVAETLGQAIWRRPLLTAEIDALVTASQATATALNDSDEGLKTLLVLLLASPHFLYRVEAGEADPDVTDGRRYTSWEMASRLSFFLWNTVPDAELRAAAERGDLVTEAGLQTQVDRMLTSAHLRDGLRNLIADWLDLYALDEMSKDPNVFRHFSADLGVAAREETLLLAEHLFLTEDHDFRELLTTRTTFVNRRLAAIYNVPASVDDGFGRVELPADGARAGVLGHVAFLALHAHPTASSATRRGVAVRKRLLCQATPSPPANLNTAIPEPSPTARTLKERLQAHQADPTCGGCHTLLDPPGYGLENFDGIGRYRLLDNDAPIDPSGEIDRVTFETPGDLYQVIAEHPDLLSCAVRTVYSYANGHLPEQGEREEQGRLLEVFKQSGHRMRPLMAAVAMSPGFRRVGAAVNEESPE